MQNFLRTTAVVVICFVTLTVPSFGQGNSHHNKAKHNHGMDDDDDGYRGNARDGHVYDGRHVSIVFSVHDREILRDYYRHGSNLPPGLAKRGGNLPPGLAKQLQRNGTLPPGLQKRLTPFPEDLDGRLSRLPSIYRRGTIGGAVVIVDRRTQRIIDVIDDILRP